MWDARSTGIKPGEQYARSHLSAGPGCSQRVVDLQCELSARLGVLSVPGREEPARVVGLGFDSIGRLGSIAVGVQPASVTRCETRPEPRGATAGGDGDDVWGVG